MQEVCLKAYVYYIGADKRSCVVSYVGTTNGNCE